MTTAVSRYQVVWDTLKQKGTVKLSAPTLAHKRLKRAVIKRKDLDLGFKLETAEKNLRSFLIFQSTGNVLTITLALKIRSTWI